MENQAQLTINEIAAALQVIDIVTSRGAFRGDELSQVGGLRDKFAAFVRAAQEAQDAEKAKQSEELTVDTSAG
jgi:hypothetical protein